MGKRGSIGLTPGQQEWRRHLGVCARSGETVRAYAKRHGFSEHAMYQASKEQLTGTSSGLRGASGHPLRAG